MSNIFFPPTTINHNATSLIFNTQQLEHTLGSIGSVILEDNYIVLNSYMLLDNVSSRPAEPDRHPAIQVTSLTISDHLLEYELV
jgi:hypothetical protein